LRMAGGWCGGRCAVRLAEACRLIGGLTAQAEGLTAQVGRLKMAPPSRMAVKGERAAKRLRGIGTRGGEPSRFRGIQGVLEAGPGQPVASQGAQHQPKALGHPGTDDHLAGRSAGGADTLLPGLARLWLPGLLWVPGRPLEV
jgi:hypothetical protein